MQSEPSDTKVFPMSTLTNSAKITSLYMSVFSCQALSNEPFTLPRVETNCHVCHLTDNLHYLSPLVLAPVQRQCMLLSDWIKITVLLPEHSSIPPSESRTLRVNRNPIGHLYWYSRHWTFIYTYIYIFSNFSCTYCKFPKIAYIQIVHIQISFIFLKIHYKVIVHLYLFFIFILFL